MTWETTDNYWYKEFCWFIVDEGEIQYAFKNQVAALTFKEQGYLNYMLLTNLDNIINDTMLDPRENRSWSDKIQTCKELIFD